MPTTLQIEQALTQIRSTFEKLGAQIDALTALLAQEPTVGQNAKKILDFYAGKWGLRHEGAKFIPNGAKDMNLLKRLQKDLEPGEICRRMLRYLASQDKFIVEAKHPIGLFVANVNKYALTQAEDDASFLRVQVVDCQHTPRCRSDQEHTKRKMADVRGNGHANL